MLRSGLTEAAWCRPRARRPAAGPSLAQRQPQPGRRRHHRAREILSSRLALAMMDRASWSSATCARASTSSSGARELDPNDAFRPHVLARIATASWRAAGLSLEDWRGCRRCCTRSSRSSSRRRLPSDQRLAGAAPRDARGRPAAQHQALRSTRPGSARWPQACRVLPGGRRPPAHGNRMGVGEETRMMTRRPAGAASTLTPRRCWGG